ncbi:hypothetical protein E4O05_06960 [Treponema sp. OMZ 787]|uniref:hypothetical protein n=1 Tax=Treponema sp. OMZ 787 TaxID=2563669 RepID=UPI0020A4C5AF|nr:hypothetical protein [Treponema sp. OMZ 787]UTC61317.1 hypothetical protein E4O05_06960 [Treponema sp. OMZ 787]
MYEEKNKREVIETKSVAANTEKKVMETDLIVKTSNTTIEETRKKFEKPGEYDRALFDSQKAKSDAKDKAFKSEKIVRDPVTGKELVRTQKEAKEKYGEKWQDHAAESDHDSALKHEFEKYKNIAWNTTDDISEEVNKHITVTSRTTNNAKRDKTNREFVTDKDKLKEKNISTTAYRKEKFAAKGEKASDEIKVGLGQKAKINIKDTAITSAKSGALSAGGVTFAVSTVKNITAAQKGEKKLSEAVKDTVLDTAKAAARGGGITSVSTVATQSLRVSGNEALKKIAETGAIPKVLSGVVVFGPDLYKASISKTISWTQLGKNFSVIGGGIAGSVAGAKAGGAIGAKLGTVGGTATGPVGTASGATTGAATGATIGSIVGGMAGAKTAKALSDMIARDDAEIMVKTMNERVAELAAIYRLSEEEFTEKVLPQIQKKVDGKWLIQMFKYSSRDDIKKQKEFVDKEFLEIYVKVFNEKRHVPFFTWLKVRAFTKRQKSSIQNISCPNISMSFLQILITGIIIFILITLFICMIVPLFKSCEFKSKEKQPMITESASQSVQTKEIPDEVSTYKVVAQKLYPETKSFEFRKDRRDFVNPVEAESWFKLQAEAILEVYKLHPELKIKISGYVAIFDNEIDEMVLALERAENIKKGLIKYGVPEEILITVPVGKTDRWGKDRKNNRAVTIESIENME